MSKFMDKLKALAGEPDEAKRVELAGALDKEADELDANWGNRDAFGAVEKERDTYKEQAEAAAKERDEWKVKYADRFFEGAGDGGNADKASTTPSEPVKIGVAGLWQE